MVCHHSQHVVPVVQVTKTMAVWSHRVCLSVRSPHRWVDRWYKCRYIRATQPSCHGNRDRLINFEPIEIFLLLLVSNTSSFLNANILYPYLHTDKIFTEFCFFNLEILNAPLHPTFDRSNQRRHLSSRSDDESLVLWACTPYVTYPDAICQLC